MTTTVAAQRLERLACAMWAKEKCTTKYGIDIDAWESMIPFVKNVWIGLAKKHLRAFKRKCDES